MELALVGYTLFRSDTPGTRYGWDAFIYNKGRLLVVPNFSATHHPEDRWIDVVSILVSQKHHQSLMCCVY